MEGIIEFLCADGNELEKEGKNSLNQGLERRELLKLWHLRNKQKNWP